jgi:hypothetical protein
VHRPSFRYDKGYSIGRNEIQTLEQAGDLQEKKDKPPSRLLKVFAGGVLLFTWLSFLQPFVRYQFWQSDTFWLIETGRLIMQKQVLPSHDPYSFASSAPHWIQYQWLTEVIFAIANAVGGLTAVAFFGAVFLSGLFCVLIYRKMISDGINAMIAVVVIWSAAFSFFPDLSSLRPQLFSFLFFWLTAVICSDCKANMERWKAVAILFIVAVAWANCHISFLAGLLVLVANLIGAAIASRSKPEAKDLAITFAILTATFFLGTLFTPYRFELWGYITSVHNLYYTQEVRPLEWSKQPQLIVLTFLAICSQIVLRKKRDLGDWLALLGLLWVGSGCGRLIVYFCIYSCPLIGAAFTQVLAPVLRVKPLRLFNEAMKAATNSKQYLWGIVAISALTVFSQPIMFRRNVPVEGAKYLAQHPISGNLFCTAHAGSYLIYTSHGTIPVFMDTRMDLYDEPFVKRFAAALLDGIGWKELFAQYKIANALLPNDSKLALILDKEPDWKQTYRDADFSLYFKTGESSPQLR